MHSYSKQTEQQMLDAFTQQFLAFRNSIEDKPVACQSSVTPDVALPDSGWAFSDLDTFVLEHIQPSLSASNGGRYWGYVTGGANPVATYADWLVTTFNQNVSKGGDSVASQIEHQAIAWLCELFDLPSTFTGSFTTGATAANLLGAFSFRQFAGQKQGINVALEGMQDLDVAVFSATPHASMVKSLGMAGLGQRTWNSVPCLEDSEAMNVAALSEMLSASDSPAKVVIASAGTVTGTDYDDLLAIAALCQQHNAWLHVDAAFGIFERLVASGTQMSKGLELADSITLDCHKWLNVPYDCGVFLSRHPQLLQASCEVYANYFIPDDTPPFMSMGVENSRRFRAFPLWATLLAYGKEGIRQQILKNLNQAKALADWLETSSQYSLLKPCQLNVVLFAPDERVSDMSAKDFMERLNASGKVFVTPGEWQGKPAIRAALSNWSTTDKDVQDVIQLLSELRL